MKPEICLTAWLSAIGIVTAVFISPLGGLAIFALYYWMFWSFIRWHRAFGSGHHVAYGSVTVFAIPLTSQDHGEKS